MLEYANAALIGQKRERKMIQVEFSAKPIQSSKNMLIFDECSLLETQLFEMGDQNIEAEAEESPDDGDAFYQAEEEHFSVIDRNK